MTSVAELPHVLILEGLVAPPIAYRRVRTRLLDQGAPGVDLAPIHPHDWIRAGLRGFGALQERTAAAIARGADRAGRPIAVIGHSGGGLLARLAMAEAASPDRVARQAAQVGVLATLGTPHLLHRSPTRHRHAGIALAAFLDRHEPGAWFAPATGYVTVASDLVRPRVEERLPPLSRPIPRVQRELFGRIVGPLPTAGSDGVVPAAWAHLEGAIQLTYHDVLHGVIGGPWYGDAAIIDRWWPVVVGAWSRALVTRSTGPTCETDETDGAGGAGGAGGVTILGRANTNIFEDPFGPGDPLVVARLLRRALSAAQRHAVDVRRVVLIVDAPPPPAIAARFVRRALGPSGARMPLVVAGMPGATADARMSRALVLAQERLRDEPPGVVMAVLLGPGDAVSVLCVG